MLKRWPVILRLLIGCAAFIGAIVVMTYKEHGAAEKYKATCQETVRPVQVPFLAQEYPPGSSKCQDPKEYMPWWYVLIAWPEGIAAWGLLFTLGAIIWQSWATANAAKATKKSADATRDSVILQEAQLRQWLDIELVEVKNKEIPIESDESPIICTHVLFQAFNNTSLPITLQKIITRVNLASRTDWFVSTVEEKTILPPKASYNNTNYPFFFPLTLTEETAEIYINGKSFFTVSGTAFFKEASGKDSEQQFSWVVLHKPSGFEKVRWLGKPPTETRQN